MVGGLLTSHTLIKHSYPVLKPCFALCSPHRVSQHSFLDFLHEFNAPVNVKPHYSPPGLTRGLVEDFDSI